MPGNLPKEQCKVAIVDEDGVLQVFSIKKDEIVLHFKTLPGPPISSLKYVNGSGLNQGKIFVASKNEVRGYSQRGKLFLTFDSGLTEPISTMFVMDNDLFLCGKHIYTHYRDCREVGSYLCGDKIVDVVAFYSTKVFYCVFPTYNSTLRAAGHQTIGDSSSFSSIFFNRGLWVHTAMYHVPL
ncbi:unnamed protein product [Acanthoscelides obtectus]|uniref:BBS7 beta-propeller domain-containing protein n=1 Tax=Acanthoscelides obtectus TaxID=200917 RepID=A0A9P0LI38_ACAOB|nr:unnamed protein product [Acanthoscelides obtectus]CAK1621767.1 Bardet-Biedl syndrome 7 protein [Acanthoscelides obtectus]